MSEYRWANVYEDTMPRWWPTRERADCMALAGRIRCDRYRVENGILVYDPEPEPEPVPESIDEVRYVNPNMLNPYWTQAHIYTEPMGSADFPVRVRDKAADDKLLEQAERYKHKDDVRSLKEQLRRLASIAELERQLAEADQWLASAQSGCQRELYPDVGDFLDAVEPPWLLSSISDSDFSVFQVRAEIGGRRVTCYGRSLPEACRKWLDQHRAALAAKEKTDG